MGPLVKTREPIEDVMSGELDGEMSTTSRAPLVISQVSNGAVGSPMGVTVPLSPQITVLRSGGLLSGGLLSGGLLSGGSSPRHIIQSSPTLGGRYVPLLPSQIQQIQQQQQLQKQLQVAPVMAPSRPAANGSTANGATPSAGGESKAAMEMGAPEYIVGPVQGSNNRVLLSSGRYATIDPSMLAPVNALMAVASQRFLPTPTSDKPPPVVMAAAPPAVPEPDKPKKRRRRKPAEKPDPDTVKVPKSAASNSSHSDKTQREPVPQKQATPKTEPAQKKERTEKKEKTTTSAIVEQLARKVRRKSGEDIHNVEKAMPVLQKEGESPKQSAKA